MRSLLLTVLLLIPSGVLAEDQITCRQIGRYAAWVMQLRQENVPVASVIEGTRKDLTGLTRKIVLAAYEYPVFSSIEVRQKVMAEFGNQMEVICFRGGAFD